MALVRKICFVFVSFLVFVKSNAVVIPPPTANVSCSETGFTPMFKQAYEPGTVVYFNVTYGNSSLAECQGSSEVSNDTTSQMIGGNEMLYQHNHDNLIMCGGSLTNNADNTSIVFELDAEVIVTHVIRNVIKRQKKYDFILKCTLTKMVAAVSSKNSWKIDSVLDRTGEIEVKNETFTLATQLQFFKYNYSSENFQNETFSLKAGERLYVQVSETTQNQYFKFRVNKCWSTPDVDPNYSVKDVFFENGCPVDTTMKFNNVTNGSQHFYQFSIQAFFFSIGKNLAIYVHCELYICQTDETGPMCTQPNTDDCAISKRRRRRSVEGEPIERVTISSQQQIMFDTSEIYAPTCAEGHVYDRINKECTKKNILQISGVYLDIDWDPLYANTSSKAFAEFATVKDYQLYALIQSSTTNGVIRGVKVVKAIKGSVILDVQVIYEDTSDSATAFTEFETALRSTRVTTSRVLNILNIKQRPLKTVEYVPILTKTRNNMENLTLIVVVVVLLVVVFISGITFYKVRQLRRSPTTKDVNGFDNRAMDNMS